MKLIRSQICSAFNTLFHAGMASAPSAMRYATTPSGKYGAGAMRVKSSGCVFQTIADGGFSGIVDGISN
jgi:hypothetical protein